MFKLFISGHNSCPQPKSPSIDQSLDQSSVNQTLPQLVNVSHGMLTLTDPLL